MSEVTNVSLARQSGLLNELSIIANNIANASTDGFKREAGIFAEYVTGRSEDYSVSSGSLRGHFTNLAPGTLKATGAALDLAIEGEGFFAVERDGEQLLTRAGGFQRDAEGQLVTADGDAVLDDAGKPIVFAPEVSEIAIASDGTVSADGLGVGRLGVFKADPMALTRAGDNLWRSEQPPQAQEVATVRQGFIEASNVSAVTEMARLIETQRLFEAGAELASDDHERIQRMIEALAAR